MKLPNFGVLVKMPENELDALKSDMVNEVIQSAPEELKDRLRGTQFVLDTNLKLCKNNTQRMIVASKKMYDSLLDLQQILTYGSTNKVQKASKVIPLKKDRK